MKEKSLLIWPKSKNVTHINYHFSQFGEYIPYLESKTNNKIIYKDGDVYKYNECGYSDISDILELIKKEKIKKVIMKIEYENAGNSKNLIEAIKNEFKDVLIMGYGTIPRIYPLLFRNIPIDVLASSGHDQKCIESFINDFKLGCDINKLRGLMIKDNETNTFILSPSGEFIESYEWTRTPEKLARAYYEANNHSRYVLNVSTGCPFNCEHCLLQMNEGKKERRRTIDSIDRDLYEIEKEYNYIEFFAANLTLDQKYMLELCKMIKENHPSITWGCATRIDEVTRKKNDHNIIDDADLLKVMNDSGCTLVGLGVEGITGNLESIHTKNFEVEKTKQAIENIQNANIVAKAMIMLRIPNQTRQDLINTFYYLDSRNAYIRPTIYTPYHEIDKYNTSLYDLPNYNRKMIPDSNDSPVEGVYNYQFEELLQSPHSYKRILKCTKKELDLAKRIVS